MQKFNNINFLYIEDMGSFAEGTPVRKLLENVKLVEGAYPMNNYSDILRILVLYLYGGIYFDLDVISIDGFEEQFPLNFAVAQESGTVNNAVLRFSKKHSFLWFIMDEIVSNILI